MVKKIFRKDLFVSALLIAIVIFVVGFVLGFVWDSFRIDYVDSLIVKGELDAESFVVEKDFVSSFNVKDCNVLSNRMLELNLRVSELGKLLTEFDVKGMSHDSGYDYLKRKYFLLELRAYLLRKSLKEECEVKDNVVLFFYDVKDNEDFLRMGEVLDVVVRSMDNVVVFSLDRGFSKEPVLDVLETYYGVVKSPTLIVNYDKKFERFVSVNELKKEFV